MLTKKYEWDNFLVTAFESAWFWASLWFTVGATVMAWLSYFISQNKSEVRSLAQPKSLNNEPHAKSNPFETLVQECKNSDATHIKLSRKPEVFMWVWVYYLDKMRKERNTHDTVNLFNIIGANIHAPGNGNVGINEVLYTIKCLESRGYISFDKSDHGHCTMYDNNNFKFNTKYDELIKRITFHDNGNNLTMSWQ